jgi:hypothetical protein
MTLKGEVQDGRQLMDPGTLSYMIPEVYFRFVVAKFR